MDEFKPEDELKPDTSDRRPTRSRKTSSAPKVPVSRQHMMMGIGILVLLLLVIGIGSALKSPDSSSAKQPATPAGNSGSDKNIDLSGSSSMSGQSGQPATSESSPTASNVQPDSSQNNVGVPPISPTPTEAQPVQTPANQQRVELPGDLNSALNDQQGQVDAAAQAGQGESSLPTAAATVAAGAQTPRPANNKPVTAPRPTATHQNKPVAAHTPAASKPAVKESKPTAAASQSTSASHSGSTPGGNFTLQLSSASRSDTLNAWAKKQNLSGYHVYQTTRSGQPWYVLVSGSYATSGDAKRAVATLPAEVRAQNPWVKPVSQVKKEAGK